jgi:hypothetical protein
MRIIQAFKQFWKKERFSLDTEHKSLEKKTGTKEGIDESIKQRIQSTDQCGSEKWRNTNQ